MEKVCKNLTTAFPRDHIDKLDELRARLRTAGVTVRIAPITNALVFAVEAGLEKLDRLEGVAPAGREARS